VYSFLLFFFPITNSLTQIQGVQLKSGPITRPWMYHVRRYL